MKNRNSILRKTGLYRYFYLSVLLLCFVPVYGQTDLYGPEYPPPKDYSIQPSLHTNDGQLGRAGGRTFTFSNITLSNTTHVYWAIYPDEVMLSMDGDVYSASEIMDIDAANTNLGTGKVYWVGNTYMPFSTGGGANLQSRFVLTVMNNDDSPLPLQDPASVALDPKSGGVVLLNGSSMIFKARLELFVSENGTTWIPHLDYYDSHNNVPAILAYYSIEFGFWWENDPPKLDINLGANVDEGDTVIINHALLAAEDLESDSTEIFFILNPDEGPVLPAHGELYLNDNVLTRNDMITLENLQKDQFSYVHDGSETVEDSISFYLLDGDGKKCIIDGDSLFYFLFTITPQDDTPVVEINLPITVDEDSSVIITEDFLYSTDEESGPDLTTYKIDATTYDDYPEWGLLRKNGVPLSNGESFTQADIAAGLISYEQNGSENTSDLFGFTLEDEFGHLAEKQDGSTLFIFEININPVNDAPNLTKLMTLTMDEGGEGTINNAVLAASDDDNPTNEILFTIDPNSEIGDPWWGVITRDGTTLEDGDYFTMEDINSNKVKFVHDGSENYSDMFGFRLSDNAGAIYYDGPWDVFHFNIQINPVNDPPQVNSPIPDAQITVADDWTYTFPENVFTDPDPDDELTYSAVKLDENPLPAWITFTPGTRTFTANPTAGDVGELAIVVIAKDLEMATARDTFLLVVGTVGTEISSISGSIRVYPNPFTDQFQVYIDENLEGLEQISLYTITGERVYVKKDAAYGVNTLVLSDLPEGLYFVKIDYRDNSAIRKLYKHQKR